MIGRVLKQFLRESYYLATKYPGHQILSSYNPREIFEEQLEKCGVDYFDFYLLHNVYENSIQAYTDSRWIQRLPNVKMILSGMSNMEQMVDAILPEKRAAVCIACGACSNLQESYLNYPVGRKFVE